MPVPNFQVLMLPILRQFANGLTNVNDGLDALKAEFKISDEEAVETLQSGQTVLYNRAQWARTYLGKSGLLEPVSRGHHRITSLGKEVLSRNPEQITVKFLREFEKFSEWTSQDNGQSNLVSETEELMLPASQTPEDAMQAASNSLEAALKDELLTALRQMNPIRFEQLILDLLSKMGFGRGRSGFARLTPVSADGGIDGIINEDALGLDAVYIQAKRYAAENKVSRPDIQRFVGSLTGESATKGVFVTTSDFSKEARDYIARVQQRIVLIGGSDLAGLMILYDVGVRTRSTFYVKTIDDDYFFGV